MIMGRKTLESLPGKKALPQRENIVITRQADFSAEGCRVCHSIEEALAIAAQRDPDRVFVIGGAQIYAAFLPYCDKAMLTVIEHSIRADAFFPNLDLAPEWGFQGISQQYQSDMIYYHFTDYIRRK